jgi:hypothetical protein
MKLFELGRIVITPAALDFCERHDSVYVERLLQRHQTGDWGDMDQEDKATNDRAVQRGGRIFSGYHFGEDRLWIITEADRSATTILLPSDY